MYLTTKGTVSHIAHFCQRNYRDPQLQVDEKYSYLFNFRPNMCQSWSLNIRFGPNKSDFIIKYTMTKARKFKYLKDKTAYKI